MAAIECEALPPTLPDLLTLKQKSFIRFYIETKNATESARLAGYQGNDVTLQAVGSENLRKPLIRAEITRILNPIADAEEIVARLTKYSRASIADVLCDDGSFNLATAKANLSDDLIKKLKFDKDTGRVTEVIIQDQHEATRDLAKIHQLMDKTNVEVSLSDNDISRISDSLALSFIEAARGQRAALAAGPTTDSVAADSNHNP